jgi:hypothetical protein
VPVRSTAMRARLPLVLVAVALALAARGNATAAESDLGVGARFDRGSVEPGQIAVADVVVQNRGPDAGGAGTLTVAVSGGTIVRTMAVGGRCGRPDAGRRVRCTVGVSSFGEVARVVLQVSASPRAGTVRLQARLSSSADPRVANDRSEARIPISSAGAPGPPEVSYVFEAPAQAVVGRPLAARIRVLNRGPGAALVGAIALETRPASRVQMPRVPLRLAPGAERALVARVTPLRAGRLALDLRFGRGGRARLVVTVRRDGAAA